MNNIRKIRWFDRPKLDYFAEVMADSPYAYYRLGDTSGVVATDSSGNNRHGQYVGSVSLATDTLIDAGISKYLDLPANGSYVDVSASKDFCAGAEWAVEAWINPRSFAQQAGAFGSYGTTGGRLIGNNTSTGNGGRQAGFELSFFNPSTTMYWAADYVAFSAGFMPAENQLCHVVFTSSNSYSAILLNGVEVANSPSAMPTATVQSILQIGSGGENVSWTGGEFNGAIGEVSLYDHGLTGDRILVHYNAGNP